MRAEVRPADVGAVRDRLSIRQLQSVAADAEGAAQGRPYLFSGTAMRPPAGDGKIATVTDTGTLAYIANPVPNP